LLNNLFQKKLDLINKDLGEGYRTTFIELDNSNIPSFTLDYIENHYNLKFNVLIADCEGFLEIFLDENPQIYEQFIMIIYEADKPTKCNYDKISENLIKHNFIHIEKGFQNVWIK
jgi:hypothetical protein